MRAGLTAGKGVLAALVSSVPAAFRVGDETSVARALEQWLVLAAIATPIAVVGIFVVKRARVGLHLLFGERAPLLVIGLLWWCVVELALLSGFGTVLRKTTHQHALAGVTFAFFALVTGAVLAVLAKRATSRVARDGTGAQKLALLVAGAAAFLLVMLVGIRTSRTEGLHTAAALVDVMSLSVTSAIASSKLFDRHRTLAIGGAPAAILLLMVGLTTLRFDPKLRESLPETAPFHAAIIDLVP
jgi:FtsH-binding integral membrane protein